MGQQVAALLDGLGVDRRAWTEGSMPSITPLTGEQVAMVRVADAAAIDEALGNATAAFRAWRHVPAPRRGELVRLFGEELRAAKDDLARLVTIEAGKIPSEGAGEVQEMIDICDFAVGLSRQLYGLTIATERPGHRMMEVWHPLGVVGVISAFNFPVAVWVWNAALALVCGNSVVWKPSEKTPLTALATQAIFERAVARFGDAPAGLSQLLIGGREAGEALVDDNRIALLSATGSTRMGRAVAPRLAERFARAILELGGNNGVIVAPSADLDLALRGVAFGAMGTAGQRCTTTRRLFLHDSIYDGFVAKLKAAYVSVGVGNPLEGEVLVGPLIDRAAWEMMQEALVAAKSAGGVVTGGERVGEGASFYVRPALVEMPGQVGPVLEETFAPILYVMRYDDLGAVIDAHNAVAAGLSSAIFTTDMREAERFLAASDCGIANVNLGTSGAEIGGAFGGEKETGGGRESGSDSWRQYMRRATNTVNYSDALPLAQGVSFEI
ncbi:MAG: aldehyde dehydrogenase family protein [Sphingopyxis sp.]|nr:aldehyde dehydrogenase family protein [Sphingopyxis sp.]